MKKWFDSLRYIFKSTRLYVCVLFVVLLIPQWLLYADVSDKYKKLAREAAAVYGSGA